MFKVNRNDLQRCISCHRNGFLDAHKFGNLNWTPSGLQFRVYGHDHDRIEKNTPEYAEFQQFLKTREDPKLGTLYRLLPKSYETDRHGDIVFKNQPVQIFTEYTYSLANKNVAESFRHFSGYANYQYAIAGALLNYPNIDRFLPADSRSVHEFWLNKTSVEDIAFQFQLASLKETDPDSDFQKTLAGQTSISGTEFYQQTTLPFTEAFSVEINQLNQDAAKDTVLHEPPDLTARLMKEQLIFSSKTYVDRLAKLIYIFKGYYPEMPMLAAIAVNEVVDKMHLVERTFRLEGADRSPNELLARDFGPAFLKANPELDDFKNHEMKPSELKSPLSSYCDQLSQASIAVFTKQPLDKSKTGGQNGDLCNDRLGLCRISLGCRDRGDGKHACTGANVENGTFGQTGQLCAGRSESTMCGIGMQCQDRGDKVLVCAVSPAGTALEGDLCSGADKNFCADGLSCLPGEFGLKECLSSP